MLPGARFGWGAAEVVILHQCSTYDGWLLEILTTEMREQWWACALTHKQLQS